MFCPSCGTESTGLNYCNRCGANLTAPLATPAEPLPPVNLTKPMLIIGSITTFITLAGFFMILESATVLARSTGGGDLPMAIVFFGMITLLTLDIFLLRQMSKLISAALSPERRVSEKRAAPENTFQLQQPTTARLTPGGSVTENTTRFFDTYSSSSTAEPVPVKKTN